MNYLNQLHTLHATPYTHTHTLPPSPSSLIGRERLAVHLFLLVLDLQYLLLDAVDGLRDGLVVVVAHQSTLLGILQSLWDTHIVRYIHGMKHVMG